MSISPLVRPAESGDLDALVSMWRDFMDFHAARDPEFAITAASDAVRREFLEAKLREPDAFVLLAIVEGQAAGYVLGEARSRPPVFAAARFGLVTDLYVAPERRRSGLGRRLLGECLAWFRAREIGRIEVRALTSNPAAASFWAGQGFVPFAQESVLRIGGPGS